MGVTIKNGLCMLPSGPASADVEIQDGRVLSIVPSPSHSRREGETIDADGLVVLPGAIDAHVHTRDPGATHKEDFEHASRAAAVSGVTTIIVQPNTDPAPVDAAGFTAVADAAQASRVDVAICGGLPVEDPDPGAVAELAECGVAALEVLGDIGRLTEAGWRRVFSAASGSGLPVALFAADQRLMRREEVALRARGRDSWEHLAEWLTPEAEVVGFQRAIDHAAEAGVPLIIRQVTTGPGVDAIHRHRSRSSSPPVWLEVAAHHLALTNVDATRLKQFGHMIPPLRPPRDVRALWSAVSDGVVDFVSSDHAPHTAPEKLGSPTGPWETPPGIPGLDTLLLPLFDAVHRKHLSWERLVQLVCAQPAKIHGLWPRKGQLAVGSDADIALIDPAGDWTITEDTIYTACGWSPFVGKRGHGRPTLTLRRGEVVASEGRPVGGKGGHLIRRQVPRAS